MKFDASIMALANFRSSYGTAQFNWRGFAESSLLNLN